MNRIYLVRHGESEANVDKAVHYTKPDHAIALTSRGLAQATGAGQFLRAHLTGALTDEYGYTAGWCPTNLRVWNSPYQRTRETASVIMHELEKLTAAVFRYQDGTGNERVRPLLKVDRRESILLAEQQFGMFDGIPDEELAQRFPAEHAHYELAEKHGGKFWARMPMGESRFDVAMRVHQFFGTLQRDKHEVNGIYHTVIVCHGVTMRAFLMQWFNLPFEWFEAEPNPGNCDVRLIKNGKDMGYVYRSADAGRELGTPVNPYAF